MLLTCEPCRCIHYGLQPANVHSWRCLARWSHGKSKDSVMDRPFTGGARAFCISAAQPRFLSREFTTSSRDTPRPRLIVICADVDVLLSHQRHVDPLVFGSSARSTRSTCSHHVDETSRSLLDTQSPLSFSKHVYSTNCTCSFDALIQ